MYAPGRMQGIYNLSVAVKMTVLRAYHAKRTCKLDLCNCRVAHRREANSKSCDALLSERCIEDSLARKLFRKALAQS